LGSSLDRVDFGWWEFSGDEVDEVDEVDDRDHLVLVAVAPSSALQGSLH